MSWYGENTVFPNDEIGRIISDIASDLNSQGSIMIVAANNNGSLVPSIKRESARDEKIILVASLDQNGLPASFTNYADSVTIATPYSPRAYRFSLGEKTFGGTSASTPLVTGTLGGFTLLSGYRLEIRQAKNLLKKTSVPLVSLPSSHALGFGMLNSYKIGRVAQRLKEKCQEYGQDSQKKECMASHLETEGLYDFDDESVELFERGIDSFPECSENENGMQRDESSSDQAAAFHNLRRAALLRPTNGKTWGTLACVKEKYFQGGEVFYQSLAQSLEKTENEILGEICSEREKAYLSKYVLTSSLEFIFGQSSCQPETLLNAIHILFRDWPSDGEELFNQILARKKVSRHIINSLRGEIKDNFDKIPNARGLLD